MKFKSFIAAACAALFIVFAAASVSFAQSDDEAGGYVEVETTDTGVRAAADYAVKARAAAQSAQIRLVRIDNARQQVVAGMNYQICMEVTVKGKTDAEPVRRSVVATVYRNLQNAYKLTGWTEDDCGE